MTDLKIRPAAPQDAAVILQFIQSLADYEKAPTAVIATVSDIETRLFDPHTTTRALIAENNGQAIGFAVYFMSFSTWQGKNGLYLEDLYVVPEQRGCGAGKALLTALARLAIEKSCGRLEWSVLDWNTPAIEFYESIGAEALSEWVRYRLSGEALQRLADAREL